MRVIDHTEPKWSARYASKGRENGAATYSRDILKHHIPIWEKFLALTSLDLNKVVISTCPLVSEIEGKLPADTQLVIQYLHTYDYADPFGIVKEVMKRYPNTPVWFVTSYKAFAIQMELLGVTALWLPMMIDATEINKTPKPTPDNRYKDRVIYFGNVTQPKYRTYHNIKNELMKAGWTVDTISNNLFNNQEPVKTQPAAWEILKDYQYGIGVGRCALEMYALGLQVIIAGAQFGGIIIDETDAEAQLKTNLNGRIVTFDRDFSACMRAIPMSQRLNATEENMVPKISENIMQFMAKQAL